VLLPIGYGNSKPAKSIAAVLAGALPEYLSGKNFAKFGKKFALPKFIHILDDEPLRQKCVSVLGFIFSRASLRIGGRKTNEEIL